MTESDVRKLSRVELLEILLKISEENEVLRTENEQLKAKINTRDISINNSGSIAEASLGLSNVFGEAQKAADVYLENIKRQEDESRKRAQSFVRTMEENCRIAEEKVKRDCDEVRKRTEDECAKRLRQAQTDCVQLENRLKTEYQTKLDELSTLRSQLEEEKQRFEAEKSQQESRRGLFGKRR